MKKLFVLIGQEQRERCKAYIDSLPFGRIAVEIGPYKKKRSVPFNNYYWGFVVAPMAEHCGYTPDEMHEELLGSYFGWETREFMGHKREVPRRTTTSPETLTTTEMQDYVYHCQRVAAQMNVPIQDDPEMRAAG